MNVTYRKNVGFSRNKYRRNQRFKAHRFFKMVHKCKRHGETAHAKTASFACSLTIYY